MLDNCVPPYSATLVNNLQTAGAVMLGKTNMDEFAMGSSNETSYYGPVKNPWAVDCVPGGSSGGSAAAVAARLTPGATASDTGGSIRDRKSTRLNSSHVAISYAVFCLKKKNNNTFVTRRHNA